MKLTLLLPALTCFGLLACAGRGASDRETVDILITGGTVITMDSARRVLEDGAVAILGDRIVAVGPSSELLARFTPRETIDAKRKVVMPGLIDGHGHGVTTLSWDLQAVADPTPPGDAVPGRYRISVSAGGVTVSGPIDVMKDPILKTPQ